MLALPPPPPPRGPLVGGKRRREDHPPPRSDRNDDPVPPPPATAEAGSLSMGLAGAKAGAPPSTPAKVRIVASHPDNEIATAMMEEEGGCLSATMVAAGDADGHGGRRPGRRRWQLKVVLPSSALPPSCNDGGLRGAQKPVAHCLNAIADAVVPARCTEVGTAASRARKTKAEAEAETTTGTTWTTQTARTTPVLEISCHQGGFNNQQGQEAVTEGSGVGPDGRMMMRQWLR